MQAEVARVMRESDAEGTGAGAGRPPWVRTGSRGRGKGPAAGAPALCPKESQEKWTRPGFWSLWGLVAREGQWASKWGKMEEGQVGAWEGQGLLQGEAWGQMNLQPDPRVCLHGRADPARQPCAGSCSFPGFYVR